jgi:hypothetical protein
MSPRFDPKDAEAVLRIVEGRSFIWVIRGQVELDRYDTRANKCGRFRRTRAATSDTRGIVRRSNGAHQ